MSPCPPAHHPVEENPIDQIYVAVFEARRASLDWDHALRVPTGTDMVLNATTVGSAPEWDELNLDFDSLADVQLAVDIVTRPRVTPFLAQAQRRNVRTIDGFDMLFYFARTFAAAEGYETGERFFGDLKLE
jgi:shikimate dehydrogenase